MTQNDFLSPDKTGPIDFLTREQVKVYHDVYKLTKGDPMTKHKTAWRAAVEKTDHA